jgi:exosortase N
MGTDYFTFAGDRGSHALDRLYQVMKKYAHLSVYILILVGWMANGYLRSDLTFVTGLLLLPAAAVLREPGQKSLRFGLSALVCAGLALLMPARTLHFLALIFAMFFVVETWWGRFNTAPVFIALCLTAVVKTMSIILGFEIRLALSATAATLLRGVGWAAEAEGNIIHFRGQPYSVDPECMGLLMVEVSFLLAFVLLGLFERNTGKRPPAWAWIVVVGSAAILVVFYNLLRIICLVVLDIKPATLAHEAIGLFGLAVYAFIPLWFGLVYLFRRWAVAPLETTATPVQQRPTEKFVNTMYPVLHGIVLVALGYFAFTQNTGIVERPVAAAALVPKGLPSDCQMETLRDGVAKYTNDSILIYVKPMRGFYSTEHTPLICWQGSGYRFGKTWKNHWPEAEHFMGTLEKKNEILYTAWWYDNGTTCTTNQTRWRYLDAVGAPEFCLINVTAESKEVLERQVRRMLLD